ncbi:unnamed protein product [Paramecium primaurelia]|uniref:Uncharacterized protein n=2 Tax=Paramecium TaxID=5884 RepID=A0A8S1U0K9_9CILI|nr:unnamed protein product [Paramecium primaurelia]CAD8157844.1 unnamed protein product [Paramecium pentaurelia]
MSELEAQCIRMVKFGQSNIEKTIQFFDNKLLDQIINDYSKMEQNLLQTSNNLNKSLIEAESTNTKLKQLVSLVSK